MKMTSRNINFFSLLACGCIALLFVRNVYSRPQIEFIFPKLEEADELWEEPEIETTTATVSIKDAQSSISNTNHMNGNTNLQKRSNLGSYSSHDIPTLYDGTYDNGELFSPNAWPENDSDEWDESVQNDTTQSHTLRNGNESLIFLNFTGTQVQERQLQVQQQNGVSTTEGIDKIVFPTEDAHQSNEPQPTTNESQGCDLDSKHSPLCETVPYYPEESINKVLQQNDSIKYLATVDILPEIVQRINIHGEPLCKSNYQVVYPRKGMSKDKGSLTIVNQENLKQGVGIETCVNENGECSIAGSLAGGYKTSCVQKYVDRKLVAYTENNEVTQEIFPIPISCCCHLIFTGNAVERFGIGIKQGSQTTPVKNPK